MFFPLIILIGILKPEITQSYFSIQDIESALSLEHGGYPYDLNLPAGLFGASNNRSLSEKAPFPDPKLSGKKHAFPDLGEGILHPCKLIVPPETNVAFFVSQVEEPCLFLLQKGKKYWADSTIKLRDGQILQQFTGVAGEATVPDAEEESNQPEDVSANHESQAAETQPTGQHAQLVFPAQRPARFQLSPVLRLDLNGRRTFSYYRLRVRDWVSLLPRDLQVLYPILQLSEGFQGDVIFNLAANSEIHNLLVDLGHLPVVPEAPYCQTVFTSQSLQISLSHILFSGGAPCDYQACNEAEDGVSFIDNVIGIAINECTVSQGIVSCPKGKTQQDKESVSSGSQTGSPVVSNGMWGGRNLRSSLRIKQNKPPGGGDGPQDTPAAKPSSSLFHDSDQPYKDLLRILMYGPDVTKNTPDLLSKTYINALYLHNLYQLLGDSSDGSSDAQGKLLEILNQSVFEPNLTHDEMESIQQLAAGWNESRSIFYRNSFDTVSRDPSIRTAIERSRDSVNHHLIIIQQMMARSFSYKGMSEGNEKIHVFIFDVTSQFEDQSWLYVLNSLLHESGSKSVKTSDLETVKKLKEKIKPVSYDQKLKILAILTYKQVSSPAFENISQSVSSMVNTNSLTQYLSEPEIEEISSAETSGKSALHGSHSELFKQIFSGATDPAMMLDEKTLILASNTAAQHLFGFLEEDSQSYSIEQLSPPKQPDEQTSRRALSGLLQQLDFNERLEQAWRCQNTAGDVFSCQLTLLRLKTENGAITIAIIKKAVRAESAKGGYESVVDNGPPWILKANQKIAKINDMAVRVLGGKRQSDFLGKRLSEIKPDKQPSGEETDVREIRKMVHAVAYTRTMYYQSLKRVDASLLDVIITAVSFPDYIGDHAVSAHLNVLHDPDEITSSKYVQWVDRFIRSVAPKMGATFEDYFFQSKDPEFIFEMVCDAYGEGSQCGSQYGSQSGSLEKTASVSMPDPQCHFPIKAVNQAMLLLARSTFKQLLGINTAELINTELQTVNMRGLSTLRQTGKGADEKSVSIDQDLRIFSEVVAPEPRQFNWYLMYHNFGGTEAFRPVELDVIQLKIEGKTLYHAKIVSSGDIIEGVYESMNQ